MSIFDQVEGSSNEAKVMKDREERQKRIIEERATKREALTAMQKMQIAALSNSNRAYRRAIKRKYGVKVPGIDVVRKSIIK